MEKRVEQLGYDVAFNPPGDVDCFYASVAKALGIETQGQSHQFDVSIQPIVNSRTTKITLLCQLATLFYTNFRPISQLFQLQHCSRPIFYA